ncbi:MAG: hypothetical protein ACRC4N_14560 [Gammaproteobacteria bacterium]
MSEEDGENRVGLETDDSLWQPLKRKQPKGDDDDDDTKYHGSLQSRFQLLVVDYYTHLFFNLQHEAMTSAAVEVIGAVCTRLTWSKYLYYLKHFIHVLQTGIVEQKLAVR